MELVYCEYCKQMSLFDKDQFIYDIKHGRLKDYGTNLGITNLLIAFCPECGYTTIPICFDPPIIF